jgi:hypothetical protein
MYNNCYLTDITGFTGNGEAQGHFAKIGESPKLVIRNHPSSQISFFTDKPLAEFGF